MQPIALYYDEGAYVESTTVAHARSTGAPAGLMGRQVAGNQFLDAYLRHGSWSELVALTPGQASRHSLAQLCAAHPSSQQKQRRLRGFDVTRFHDEFLQNPPAALLHFPNPADPAYAWARQSSSPHKLALSGVTHTLCSKRAVEVLRGLVTDPWQEYDRLICTSAAVRSMVESVSDNYAAYLKDRHGGSPRRRIGLETIPLGVNTDRFCPPTPEQRNHERQRFDLADDEIAVLFVGRLSHHAKAHPFPMYRMVARAARQTGKRIRLLMCGWTPSDAVRNAFRDAAEQIASDVRVDFVDGMNPTVRSGVWKAADAFVSLVDNIQETFGLVIVEAMASGLPVIASDWNGYRDLVVDGQTGFLVSTLSIAGTHSDLTSRLLLGEINYDHFLARATQAVTVNSDAAAAALVRLCDDQVLRQQMGQAGRVRAKRMFDWSHVIRRYESVWTEQEQQRREHLSQLSPQHVVRGPAAYPPVDESFSRYPSCWLDHNSIVQAAADAARDLTTILNLNLMTHEAHTRCSDVPVLHAVLESAHLPTAVADLERELMRQGVAANHARATLAWLLKYELLLPVLSAETSDPPANSDACRT